MRLQSILIAGAAIALASCTSLDENSSWENSDGKVNFTSYISGQQRVQKAAGTNWADGDKIGIYMTATGQGVEKATAQNMQYIADSRGNLTAASEADVITYPANGNVDFVAYYPYTATVSGTSIALDLSDQSNPAAIDLLYSDNAKNQSASANAVNLGFSHRLSNLVLNVSTDGTLASTAGLAVKLGGTASTATFYLAANTLTAGTAADITLNANAAGTLVSGIVLPTADASAAKLTFTLGDKSVEKALNVASLEAGKSYSINVTLKGGGEQLYVSFGQATITDWTSVPGGNIDVDFEGGTVDPTPDPTPGEETTIFEETMGTEAVVKDGNYWPYLKNFTGWVSGLTFTDVNSTLSARRISDTNNIWFPANKENDLQITGFSTAGYTKLTLSYDLAANLYNSSDAQDVAAMKGTFNGQAFSTPSKVLSNANGDKDKFYTFTVELPASAVSATSELHFTTTAADNTKGLRLTNIKLVGTK